MKKFIALLSVVMVFASSYIPQNVNAEAPENSVMYLFENFNNYLSEDGSLPEKWSCFDSTGYIETSDVKSGSGFSSDENDHAVMFTDNLSSTRIVKKFDSEIPAGQDFFIEFDLYRANKSGFLLSVLSEGQAEYSENMTDYQKNLAVGMHNNLGLSTENRSKAPKLGYAVNCPTESDLNSFEKDGQYAEISSDEWHHIKLSFEPVSENETTITVSIDNGEEFSQITGQNYFDNSIVGIAISSIELNRNTAQDLRFDNISVYSSMNPPKVSKVQYLLNGMVENDAVSCLTDEINVTFDSDIYLDNSAVFKLANTQSGEEIELVPAIVDNKTIKLILQKSMIFGEEYSLYIASVRSESFETVYSEVYSTEVTPTEDRFEVLGFTAETLGKEDLAVSVVSENIVVRFSKPINCEEIEDHIYIKNMDADEKLSIVPVVSDDAMNVTLCVAGLLTGGNNYCLYVDSVSYIKFNEVIVNETFNFVPENAELSIENVSFKDYDGSEIEDMDNVSYIMKQIDVTFSLPIDTGNIENELYISDGTIKFPTEYAVSSDKTQVSLMFNEKTLEKGKQYSLCILRDIKSKFLESLTLGDDTTISFNCSEENLVIKSKVFFDENFDNFTSNSSGSIFPDGWYRLAGGGGHIALDGMKSVSNTNNEQDGTALMLSSSASPSRIVKPFTSVIPKDQKFKFELDILPGAESERILLSVLGESDIEYMSGFHTQSGTYAIYSNVSLALIPVQDKPGYMRLAYPKAARTSDQFNYFVDGSKDSDDDGYYCEINTNEWHNICTEFEPIGAKTQLTVTVDGASVYSAVTNLDYSVYKPAGTCLYIFATNGNTNKNVCFDNVKVYTEAEVKTPSVKDIVLTDTFGNTTDTLESASALTEKIEVKFDTLINFDGISNNIILFRGDSRVNCEYSIDDVGSVITLTPSECLSKNTTYNILVKKGIESTLDSRMQLVEDHIEYFRTSDKEVFELKNNEVSMLDGTVQYSFEIAKTSENDRKITAVITGYNLYNYEYGGITKSFKDMVFFKSVPFKISGTTIENYAVNAEIGNNTDVVTVYLVNTEDNSLIFSKTISE